MASEPQAPPEVSTPSEIVALIDSPRLTSLAKAGSVVTAEGQASRADGDALRTYWFTSVGALACVEEFGGSVIVRKILTGTTLLEDEGGEESVGTLPEPATFVSEEDLRAYADDHAEQAGLVVEEINYVPFLGGTAEFVLRPVDEIEFMRSLDENMYSFLREYPAQDSRPILLTFVDGSGTNRRVQGSFPLSDGTSGLDVAEGEGVLMAGGGSHEGAGRRRVGATDRTCGRSSVPGGSEVMRPELRFWSFVLAMAILVAAALVFLVQKQGPGCFSCGGAGGSVSNAPP